MKFISTLLISFLILQLNASAAPVSDKKIKRWLNNQHIEIGRLQKIYLRENERAYIAPILYRNEEEAVALVRPELEEAQIIPRVADEYEILDFDHDGVSEVIYSITQTIGSQEVTKRHIVQLSDYSIVELYSRSTLKQKQCNLCIQESLVWNVRDLNHDKIKDLEQTYKLVIKTPTASLTLRKDIKYNYFIDNAFKQDKPLSYLFKELIIAPKIENRIPVDVRTVYALNEGSINVFLDFSDVTKKQKITYQWIHEKLGLVLTKSQTIKPAKRYRTWMAKNLKDDKRYIGKWIVIISDEEHNILASQEFSVTKPVTERPEKTVLDTNQTAKEVTLPIPNKEDS